MCYSDAMSDSTKDTFDTVLVRAAGISADHPLADVLSGRGNIIELSEKSHDAALKPEPSGGLTHSERAALACRMARLSLEGELSSHYESMIEAKDTLIIDPSFDGAENARLKAIIGHTDLVTRSPKDASAGDIAALKGAGIPEEDIVRLSELISFVNYQVRVVAGLRLMVEAS